MRDDADAARRWRHFLWLCDALRPLVDPARSPPRPIVWPKDPADGLALLTMAADHAISPALSFAIGDNPVLPAEVADHLAAVRYLNQERNARILDGIHSVAAALADRGIHAVFLKGAASLIDALHVDPAARFVGDIDVLVPPERARDASAALSAQGFAEIDTYGRRWIALRHHHLPMHRHVDTGVGVELHTGVLFPRFAPILCAETVRNAAVTAHFRGRPVRLPSLAHRIVHNIVHEQMADAAFVRACCTLRQLLDLALLCRRHGDPFGALEGADTLPPRARKIAHHTLALTGLLGTSFAVPNETAAARAHIRRGIERPRQPLRVDLEAYLYRLRTEPLSALNLLIPSRLPGRVRAASRRLKHLVIRS